MNSRAKLAVTYQDQLRAVSCELSGQVFLCRGEHVEIGGTGPSIATRIIEADLDGNLHRPGAVRDAHAGLPSHEHAVIVDYALGEHPCVGWITGSPATPEDHAARSQPDRATATVGWGPARR
jgi:hypothetical protein